VVGPARNRAASVATRDLIHERANVLSEVSHAGRHGTACSRRVVQRLRSLPGSGPSSQSFFLS